MRDPAPANPARDAGPGPGWPVIALALAVMAAGAWLATRLADPYDNPDSRAFEALARALLAGRGLVYREPMLPGLDLHAFRSPGYAVFLAATLGAGGLGATLAAQGALAGLAALVWADLARRIAGARAAMLTLAATLGLGIAWRFAAQLMSETLYVALLALGLRLVWELIERARAGMPPGAWRVGALGVILAATVLTRPSGAALVLGAGFAALVSPPARRGLLAALAVALVLWSAWPLRNARVFGAPVPSLTSGGLNAWNGATGRPVGEGWRIAADSVALGERGLDRMFWRLATAEMRAHPAAAVSALVHKTHDYAMPPAPRLAEWPHILLWGPALAALLFVRRRGWPWWVLPGVPVVVWAGHAAVAVLTVVSDRYRFPTDGIVMLLGALGVDAMLRRWGIARGALATAVAMTLGVLLALTRHH